MKTDFPIRYGLGFTLNKISEIMYRVYAGSCSFNKICTRKRGNDSAYAFLPKKHFSMSSCLKNVFLSCHANIVQRVKSCYKIKINYRESKSCFCVVLLQC